MKIKVTKTHREKVEVDIEFPIYRLHEHGDEYVWSHYYRMHADGSYDSISKKHSYIGSRIEWEIERGKTKFTFHDFDEDFYTAKGGSYEKITAEQFARIVSEVSAVIAEIAK